MATDEVKKYIAIRYDRWHDYAAYHCAQAGIPDESFDVLNEVLCSLLKKPAERLTKMYNKISGEYREIDWYVLRMIKLNATSPTSPYQHKYKPIPRDMNADYSRIEIEDEEYDEVDRPADILEKTRLVREIYSDLMISDHAKEVFEYRFFNGEMFSNWPGPEKEKDLFDTYYKVVNLIKETMNGGSLFHQFEKMNNMEEKTPKISITNEVLSIVSQLEGFDISKIKKTENAYPSPEQAIVYLVSIELGANDDELIKTFNTTAGIIHKSAETMREILLSGGEGIKIYDKIYDMLDQM